MTHYRKRTERFHIQDGVQREGPQPPGGSDLRARIGELVREHRDFNVRHDGPVVTVTILEEVRR